MDFECRYCGHGRAFIEPKTFKDGTIHHGLYCRSCKKHNKWIKRDTSIAVPSINPVSEDSCYRAQDGIHHYFLANQELFPGVLKMRREYHCYFCGVIYEIEMPVVERPYELPTKQELASMEVVADDDVYVSMFQIHPKD